MLAPLPELAPGHLSSRGIFHEVIDWHTTNAFEPAFHVAEADVQVLANAFLGNAAGHVHVEEVICRNVHIFSALVDLIWCRHVCVKDIRGNRGKRWMSDPGAIVASTDFSELVLSNVVHRDIVGFLVVLDGDLSSHSTHGMNLSLVASLDEQSYVRIHERNSHRYSRAIWKDKVGIVAEFLDDGEDVIPPTAIQARAMIAELIDNLVHLKCRSDGLNQDRTSDSAPWHADVVLRKVEDIVPEASLEVGFHLGQVEVRAGSSLDKLLGIVEEVEAEVEQAAGDGFSVNGKVLLF